MSRINNPVYFLKDRCFGQSIMAWSEIVNESYTVLNIEAKKKNFLTIDDVKNLIAALQEWVEEIENE
jgi:hypothetical protein